MITTKFKLNYLKKNKERFRNKVNLAFYQVKRELVELLNSHKGNVDVLTAYLAQCTETDDVITFIKLIQDAINTAKECKDDPDAKRAIFICSYILLRLNLLSHFTLHWTNVVIKCDKCGQINKVNFIYTDKLCKACGNIIIS